MWAADAAATPPTTPGSAPGVPNRIEWYRRLGKGPDLDSFLCSCKKGKADPRVQGSALNKNTKRGPLSTKEAGCERDFAAARNAERFVERIEETGRAPTAHNSSGRGPQTKCEL